MVRRTISPTIGDVFRFCPPPHAAAASCCFSGRSWGINLYVFANDRDDDDDSTDSLLYHHTIFQRHHQHHQHPTAPPTTSTTSCCYCHRLYLAQDIDVVRLPTTAVVVVALSVPSQQPAAKEQHIHNTRPPRRPIIGHPTEQYT